MSIICVFVPLQKPRLPVDWRLLVEEYMRHCQLIGFLIPWWQKYLRPTFSFWPLFNNTYNSVIPTVSTMYRTCLKKWQTIDFFIKKTYDLKEYCQIIVVLSTLLANYIYFNSANLNDLHITGIVLVMATPKGLNDVLKRF